MRKNHFSVHIQALSSFDRIKVVMNNYVLNFLDSCLLFLMLLLLRCELTELLAFKTFVPRSQDSRFKLCLKLNPTLIAVAQFVNKFILVFEVLAYICGHDEVQNVLGIAIRDTLHQQSPGLEALARLLTLLHEDSVKNR